MRARRAASSRAGADAAGGAARRAAASAALLAAAGQRSSQQARQRRRPPARARYTRSRQHSACEGFYRARSCQHGAERRRVPPPRPSALLGAHRGRGRPLAAGRRDRHRHPAHRRPARAGASRRQQDRRQHASRRCSEIWLAARGGGYHYQLASTARWRDTRDGSEFFDALSRTPARRAARRLLLAAERGLNARRLSA
ncbi:MAG: hypothetical protein MZW92_63445 [Comamonadaceae bacterium]|nr:hypothetical protein [Comamonadaceae bacterium]